MRNIILTLTCMLFSVSLMAQVKDSIEGPKIMPIMSEQPVVFDRDLISAELEALEQPLIPAGEIVVEKDFITTRFKDHEARKLTIPEVDQDNVKRHWSRFLRKNGEGRVRTDGNTITVTGLLAEQVSSEPFDVVMQFEQFPESVSIWMTAERDSIAMTADDAPSLFTGMENFLKTEGADIYRQKIEEDIAQEKKALQNIQNEYDKLIRDNEKLHKRVTDNNIKIDDANRELDALREQRKYAGERANGFKDDLMRALDKDEKKSLKKALKDAEREIDKIDKDRNKLYNRLVGFQREIQEYELLISANLDNQRDILFEIRKQELLIAAHEAKLSEVK